MNRISDSALIVESSGVKGDHIEAFRSGDNSYAMIYLPVGRKIMLNTHFLKSEDMMIWWFNPRDKTVFKVGMINKKNFVELISPSLGIKNDWVLVVDDPVYKFEYPGSQNFYDKTVLKSNTSTF